MESGKAVVPSLKRNFSWTAFGNVVYAGCQWGMLSVLAKLGSPQMVGQFALAVALTTPIFSLANMQLRAMQATDARREYEFGDYVALRCITTLIAYAAIAGFSVAGVYSGAVASVLLVMGVSRAFDAMSDVFYGRFQQQEQMDLIAKGMMVNGLVSLVGLSLGVRATGTLIVGVAGSVIGSAMTLALVIGLLIHREHETGWGLKALGLRRATRVIMPRWSLSIWKLFVLTLPMGVVTFLAAINSNIPRYVLEAFGDERGVGIFSALAYLLVAGTTVVTALGQSASPRLARMYAADNTVEFVTLLRKLTVFGLAVGGAGTLLSLVAGGRILSILYTPEYAEYTDVLVVLAASAAFSFAASFMGYGMTSARRFRSQVPLFLCVAGVSLVLGVILVRNHGLVGAAWSVLGASVAQLVGAGLVVRRAIVAKNEKHA